jgi:hypothetical protein
MNRLIVALAAVLLMACGCEDIVITTDDPAPANACQVDADGNRVCPRNVREQLVEAFSVVNRGELGSVFDTAETASNLIDLPPEMRTSNYAGGSCMHAAIQDVLKWHGLNEAADWWRDNLSGGYSVSEGARQLEEMGFQFAYTTDGDEELLEWCSRNRHGAAIHYYTMHAITFRGYANGYAYLTDNNRTDAEIEVPKSEFVRNWKGYGGAALTVVYSPAPPVPTL